MEEFDINSIYSTLVERAAAARSMLRATSFGRGRVVSIIQDGDKIKFQIPLLGKIVDTIGEAVREAAGLSVNEVFSFEGGKTSIRAGNKMNAPASFFESVYDKLQKLTPEQIKILEEANIDVKDLKSLNFDLFTSRSEEGGTAAVVKKIEQLKKDGIVNGISVIDDEGARVIQFKAGGKLLNTYQSHLILNITGHGILDPETFGRALRDGDASSLAKNLGKLPKRLRGIIADRDLSLAGDELTAFLTLGDRSKSLVDSTLVLDPQFEILKMFASETGKIDNIKGFSKATKAYYQDANAEDYIGNVINSARGEFGDSTIAELKNAINSFNKGKSGWQSDHLKKYLKEGFAYGSDDRSRLVDNIFQTIEYGDDGSSYLNARYLNNYKAKIKQDLKDINIKINDLSIPVAEREDLLLKRVELESLVSNLADVTNLQQITGRGNFPGLDGIRGGIKTAFEVKDFDKPELRNFAMVVSKFSLKKETSISGNLPQLIVSGLGQGSVDTYVDPVSAAFLPEVFADEETIDAIEQRGKAVLAEFQDAIDSRTLPDRVLNQLKIASSQSMEMVPAASRQSALRNREFARSLLELHKSGISPNSSPQMMNMLHAFFATQAYREKKGFRQGLLPETFRFAIDTEKSGVSDKDNRILGSGFERLKGMTAFDIVEKEVDGKKIKERVKREVVNIDQDILQFRVTGHKMLVAPQAVAEVRHALGGFDLDDKTLSNMRTYVDGDGRNRLGFYITRQPSGPEEVIFARAKFDAETVKSIFDYTHFNKTLDKMLSDENHKGILIDLRRVLKGELIHGYDEANLEEAIVSVYEQMEKDKLTTLRRLSEKEIRSIGKYGSSSLQVNLQKMGDLTLEDYLPQYKNDKIYRVLGQSDAFDMSKELRDIIELSPVDSKIKKQLLNSNLSFQDMMRILGSNFEKNEQSQTILAAAFDLAARERALQSGGILGQYVNRSMFAGSVLNQYEDMFNAIKSTEVKNFLAKNYNIGLLSQEEAIDASINFTGTRQLNAELMKKIAGSSSVDQQKMATAIQELTGITGGGKNVTLDVIGEQVMSNLGKLVGFSRGIDVDASLKIGIDKYLMESRLKGADIETIARGMLTGMENAIDLGLGGDSLADEVASLRKLLEKQNDDEIKKYLLKTIGLSADSRYASLTKLQKVGLLIEQYFDTTRKLALSSMSRDEILLAASPAPEAKRVAQSILDDNKKQFNTIAELTRQEIRDLSEEQKALRRGMSEALGNKIYGQMEKAVQASGVSMEDLVNAIDQANAGTYRDILSLGSVTESGQKVYEQIIQARNLRKIKFYERFNQDAAKTILSYFNFGMLQQADQGEPIALGSLRSQAVKALDQFRSSVDESTVDDFTGTVEEGIYKILAEEASTISDDIIRQEAQKQVNILRSILENEEMGDVRAALEAKGTTDLANISPEADEELLKLVQAANNADEAEAVRPAVYKRITEKIGDFKNLFKEDKLVRRGTLAMAALAIGSLAYSAARDRTVDDITGPPLLPGGNPYEQQYPTRGYQIGSFGSTGYIPGMSYQVSIQGGRDDIDRFNTAAGGLVNGNVSTTIYNNIPSVKRDPYSAMGQAY